MNPASTISATKKTNKILVLLAHPSSDRSEAIKPLAKITSDIEGVTLVDLYAEYPKLNIDVDIEQRRLLSHDVIVFMHPLYWYSTPAILKEWQDLVLEHGFAYGSEGVALQGKIFFNALSAGGPEAAYSEKGYNHYTIRELLHPLEQMAILCRMIYLPPFAIFSARTAVEEGRLEQHLLQWKKLLEAIRDDNLNMNKARVMPTLNHDLDALIRTQLS